MMEVKEQLYIFNDTKNFHCTNSDKNCSIQLIISSHMGNIPHLIQSTALTKKNKLYKN